MKVFISEAESRFKQIKQELSGLVSRRENDFLRLGAQLGAFGEASEALSQAAANVAAEAAGDRLKQAVESVAGQLNELTGFRRTEESESSLQELGRVLEITQKVGSIMGDFSRIVKTLSMLGMSTRVESARLGEKGLGFSTLADDVEKLASKIVEHCQQISQNTSELGPLIIEAKEKTKDIIAVQQDCSETIFERVNANMRAIVSLEESSRELSSGLEVSAHEIANNISQAVSSLQFHDIVRQQVEHVEEGVADAVNVLQGQSGDNPDEEQELGRFISGMAKLQASLASHAGERLKSAGSELGSSLLGIAASVGEIGERIARMREGGGQTLEDLETGVDMIRNSLGDYAKHGAKLGALVRAVADTVSNMSALVAEIEDVGSAIELIAINASVKAARTGDEGKALGVLASAIQRLSVEAISRTDAINEILAVVAKSSEVLRANSEGYLDEERMSEAFAVLGKALAEVRESESGTERLFDSLRGESLKLGASITQSVHELGFIDDLSEKLQKSAHLLDDLAKQAERLYPSKPGEALPKRLSELLGRYTMQEERDLHNRFLGTSEQAQDSSDSNIELF